MAIVEARVQAMEEDLGRLRAGAGLGRVKPVPSSLAARVRQVPSWQACLILGSVLILAAIITAFV